jgi:hypothetical protein
LGDLAAAEAKHSALAEELEKEHLTAEAKEGRGGIGKKAFCASGGAAGAGGVDGWIGFDAGAAVCGGVCDA